MESFVPKYLSVIYFSAITHREQGSSTLNAKLLRQFGFGKMNQKKNPSNLQINPLKFRMIRS